LARKYDCIGDVRGLGLMIGVEFVKDRATRVPHPELTRRIERIAFSTGLLLLSCGQSTIRIAPPLVIDDYDVDTGLRIFDASIAEALA
jgi:4-aminobutyrate aminotransferase